MNDPERHDPPKPPALDVTSEAPGPVQLQLGRLTSEADLRGGDAEHESHLRKTGQLSRVRGRV
jgi:hypothetical protein